MYKKTTNTAHFLPRTGSYSTHPHRNGRVDVLPPNAKMHLYDIATQINDAQERVVTLKNERDALLNEIHFLRNVDKLKDKVGSGGKEEGRISDLHQRCDQLDNEIGQTRRKINELKSFVSGGGRMTYPEIFCRLARFELPGDVFEVLSSKAGAILQLTKEMS